MNKKVFLSERGAMSKVIIILAGVILLIMIVVFVAVGIVSKRNQPSVDHKTQPDVTTPIEVEAPKPVYETTLGNIEFNLVSSVNLGSYLKGETSYLDIKTTDRFIKVTISAQNKGKNITQPLEWDLGIITDSEGRNFAAITNKAYYFLPRPDLCGVQLNPEFAPVDCVRIYEVSKQSEKMKIQIMSQSPKFEMGLLDLDLPF